MFFSRVPPFFILLSIYFALNLYSPPLFFFLLFNYLFSSHVNLCKCELLQNSAIYSQIALFFALNRIFF